jgi:hypothetical protein
MDAAILGGVLVLHGDVKANHIFLLDMTPMSLLWSLRPCDGMCCFTHLITCNFHTSYHKKSEVVLSTAAADGQTHDLNFELVWAFEMCRVLFCVSFSLVLRILVSCSCMHGCKI